MAAARCRLYLVTPPSFELQYFANEVRAALDAGDVACLQLRLKETSEQAIGSAAEALIPIAQRANVAILLNDRPDLARSLGFDGAHIGQDDMAYAEARSILGSDAIIGVTCHASRHLAMEAAESGADYVAFGSFYPSATKPDAQQGADIELVRWWSELMVVPCVAIGGITIDNAPPLIEAGADFIAVSSSVWNHPGGAAASVRQFNSLF